MEVAILEEEAAEEEEDEKDGKGGPAASASGSSTGSAAARSDALKKRLFASAGLLGVYVTWTIMAWFIFTYGRGLGPIGCSCACWLLRSGSTRADNGRGPAGMLIYTNLGANAETEFSKTWGVGYALDNVRHASRLHACLHTARVVSAHSKCPHPPG